MKLHEREMAVKKAPQELLYARLAGRKSPRPTPTGVHYPGGREAIAVVR
jgi:hypothetical protein